VLPHERLDAALNERRLNLRMEWNDVAAAIGIRARSLLDIRRGRNGPNPLTARAMDDWLGWEPGSVERLLAGGDPTPRDRADEERRGAEPEFEIPADRAEQIKLAHELIARASELTKDANELTARAQQLLEGRDTA